jgi:signal transduction histidine kinase/phage shock protein PspC (stress-responsive transcriptional regulator)
MDASSRPPVNRAYRGTPPKCPAPWRSDQGHYRCDHPWACENIAKNQAGTQEGPISKTTYGAPAGPRIASTQRVTQLGLIRSADDRIITGLAGGLGHRWGIDPTIIRMAFVVLATAAGAGILLYLLMSTFSVPSHHAGSVRPRAMRRGIRPVAAVSFIVAGLLLLFEELGFWFGDALVWPGALAALGATLIWTRGDGAETSPLHRMAARMSINPVEIAFGRTSRTRILLGTLLVIGGAAAFLSANRELVAATIFFPIMVTVVGLGLVLGPWVWRLAQQVSDERRERIRSEERAEMAAHLHDSVLQTLALIQRSDTPREMSSLARVQERELRAWLYGKSGGTVADTLAVAVDAMAGRVEEHHQVAVEAIVVGDIPMDERFRALVDACGEATTNAAKHSGAGVISVYVEVEPDSVTAFVRDQGDGFDPSVISPDRGGIRESIIGRMERHGGRAEIFTDAGEGTEVQLRMPRRAG